MTFLISTSHLKRASVCIIFGFVFTQLFAQQTDGANLKASLPTTADSLIQSPATPDSLPKKRGLIKKVIDYFRDSNKPKPQNKVDFGVLPGPHYSSTTGLGLGIIGTATYTTDAADSTLARSNASVYTDMTTGGYFMVGLRGTHLFPKEKYRFDYKLKLSTFSTQFWGIGFTNGENDSNETDYRLNNINAMGRFMFKLAHNTRPLSICGTDKSANSTFTPQVFHSPTTRATLCSMPKRACSCNSTKPSRRDSWGIKTMVSQPPKSPLPPTANCGRELYWPANFTGSSTTDTHLGP